MDEERLRYQWHQFGFRHFHMDEYLTPVSDSNSAWIDAIIVTLIDMLRDEHVKQQGLSWVSMPPAQRRLVYEDVLARIAANYLPNPLPVGQRRPPPNWTLAVDTLMMRDAEISPLGSARERTDV